MIGTGRAAFEGKNRAPGADWALRKEGFVGEGEDGRKILHKLPPEAPEVSWPMGAAHDPEGGMLWGITLGGEGYLYRYDIAKNEWSARSMQGYDAGGLIFDAGSGVLIATPGPHRSNSYLRLDSSGQVLSRLDVNTAAYAGLHTVYDPGNGPKPRVVPIMVEGDLLLVELEPWPKFNLDTRARWIYRVDLQSGKVRLVR
ncbi:hypothetical protein K1T73_05435 [Roseovarius sp. SCSIO 43702]|uniref:hypothetical protein n=1 Tax=Roseovarius sp. SCSIO 43702 TaxID=2823043 RepID=UPI001C72A748|nr:hypothetical protein [Roseovarius sp. SCSIO 43702]QYX57831.1 hypothetical protein K1T73_05435 [Roseovarius sp. SCSIO 43702]